MRAKVGASRKNMSNLMNNGGFGQLTIIRNGIRINVPESWIFKKTGKIKSYANYFIDEMFRHEESLLEKEVC